MFIPFNEIDLNARIWIYQANRNITEQEAGIITETLRSAVDLWEAHGAPLTASVKLFEHRFVVIALDERDELPSGCSIDKSSHWLQEIGHNLGIDFFDRSLTYLDEHNHIQSVPVAGIKQAITSEVILPETTIFDNQVSTKAQWMTRWKVPASNSWLKRYFSGQISA